MYRLSAKAGSKGQGASASSHVDYILRDGKYSHRQDLQDSGFGNMPNFIGSNPREFWKLSDLNEGENRTVYREIELSLPIESTKEQRKELVDEFAKKNLDGHAFTYAIHDVEGNPHAHVMFCDRRHDGINREPEQFFKRANKKEPAKGGCAKAEEWGGKDRADHIEKVRESWAIIENDYFKRIGSRERVDHRTLEAQRVDKLTFAQELDDMKLEPDMAAMLRREAALLDRPADQRISARRWKLMQRTGELEEIRELRKANRELAQSRAQIIDLQAEREKRTALAELEARIGRERFARLEEERQARAASQDVVVQPKPAKPLPSPVPKIDTLKNQPVVPPQARSLVEDPRRVPGAAPTTTSSETKPSSVARPQSEALPPLPVEPKAPIQQPASEPLPKAVEPVPAPVITSEPERDPAWYLKCLERIRDLIYQWRTADRLGSAVEKARIEGALKVELKKSGHKRISGVEDGMMFLDDTKAIVDLIGDEKKCLGLDQQQTQGRKIT